MKIFKFPIKLSVILSIIVIIILISQSSMAYQNNLEIPENHPGTYLNYSGYWVSNSLGPLIYGNVSKHFLEIKSYVNGTSMWEGNLTLKPIKEVYYNSQGTEIIKYFNNSTNVTFIQNWNFTVSFKNDSSNNYYNRSLPFFSSNDIYSIENHKLNHYTLWGQRNLAGYLDLLFGPLINPKNYTYKLENGNILEVTFYLIYFSVQSQNNFIYNIAIEKIYVNSLTGLILKGSLAYAQEIIYKDPSEFNETVLPNLLSWENITSLIENYNLSGTFENVSLSSTNLSFSNENPLLNLETIVEIAVPLVFVAIVSAIFFLRKFKKYTKN